jgi:hypothetical protein
MKPTECEEFLCFNEDADYASVKLLSVLYDRTENTLTANYIYADEIKDKIVRLKPKLEQLFTETVALPLTYKFTYTRAYMDVTMLKLKIYEFLKNTFAAMSVTVKDDNIQVVQNYENFIVNLYCSRQFADFLQNSKNYAAFIKKLTDENFYGYEFHINVLPSAANPANTLAGAPNSTPGTSATLAGTPNSALGISGALNSTLYGTSAIGTPNRTLGISGASAASISDNTPDDEPDDEPDGFCPPPVAETARPNKVYNITNKEYLLGQPIKERPIKLAFIKITANEQVVAGEISKMTKREYTRSNGEKRGYWTLALTSDDQTINAVFFPNKKNTALFEKLKDGDFVVVIGIYSEKNGRQSLNISGISYCQPVLN